MQCRLLYDRFVVIIPKSSPRSKPTLGKKYTIFGKRYDIPSGMNNTTKRIVVAFRLAGEPGRRKLDRLRTAFKKHFGMSMVDYRIYAKAG